MAIVDKKLISVHSVEVLNSTIFTPCLKVLVLRPLQTIRFLHE